MSDVPKIVDTIKQLTTTPGDIIHIKLNPNATTKQAMELATDLGNYLGNFASRSEVAFIIGDVDDQISRVSEKQMNKLGWYKK